ncbi:MAG TPA: pilus assembly PilX N-terminal domain-containing protein [bacterium]|nr:pilus assembly PilX N-terminal domain-containing protein [bacterium]
MDNFLHNKRGNTLVLSLIMLTVMLAVTVGLSSAFVTELRLSKNLDEAVFSYYGAESGIEYGMYDARKTNVSLAASSTTDTFDNGVEWTRSTDDVIPSLSLDEILEDRSIQLDFYNQDNPVTASAVNSLVFDWDGAGSWALIKVTSWTPAATIDWSTKTDEEYLRAVSASTYTINLSATKAYSVKMKALYNNMSNVTVTAYDGADGTGNQVDIPNFLNITGTGEYGNSKQAINVQITRGIPLSSLYNYVIFSEESLVKELPE